MYFIDQRVQVICNQLKGLRFKESRNLPNWIYKKGQFFRPAEADAAKAPWVSTFRSPQPFRQPAQFFP